MILWCEHHNTKVLTAIEALVSQHL